MTIIVGLLCHCIGVYLFLVNF